jgi:hypothetical protein
MTLKRKLIFALLPALIVCALAYLGFVFQRSRVIYEYMKSGQRVLEGKMFANDALTGFAPIPCGEGTQLNQGYETPVKFDQRGFRIPVGGDCYRPLNRPLVLSLGDSFAFGHGISAKDTFTRLIALGLNGTDLNAGMPSYGLAHMVLQAEKLIPQYKPDYCLVQYSPWLADRALTVYGTSYPAKLGQPYLARDRSGNVMLSPPLFRTITFDLPFYRYHNERRGAPEFLSLFKNVAAPMIIHDDMVELEVDAKLMAGAAPKPLPLKDRQAAVDFAYRRIEKICAENNVKMVVVEIFLPDLSYPNLKLPTLDRAIIVDTRPGLFSHLSENTNEAYYLAYGQQAGNPSKVVDKHPNELAHRIIAEQILNAISRQGGS